MPYDPNDPLSAEFRADVSSTLAGFLADRQVAVTPIGAEVTGLVDAARLLVGGGKRFRP